MMLNAKRLLLVVITMCLGVGNICAEDIKTKTEERPDVPSEGVTVRWYGQSLIYLISSAGLRVGVDPFDNGNNRYTIPKNLPVDIILVTNEASDHNNTDIFEGSPLIFRSSIGEGTNRGNGIIFTGIPGKVGTGKSIGDKIMMFVYELDGIRFAHLGNLGQKSLTQKQLTRFGRVDVLFVPVGHDDYVEVIKQLKPKVIIPVHYRTPYTVVPLNSLEPFLKDRKVRRIDKNEVTLHQDKLPVQEEVWVLDLPKS